MPAPAPCPARALPDSFFDRDAQALARALLHEFPVVVLDEPTANVDQQHARQLLTELLGAAGRGGRTVIVISHDDVPSTLVDRHVRMTDGRLVQA